jgi:hypothetical protein
MRKDKRSALIFMAGITIVLSVSLFMSCNNSFGVFHEIQTEKQQEGTDTFIHASVKAIAEDNTNYYAAMSKIFYRPKTRNPGDVWRLLKVNDTSDYFCSGIVADSTGTLYVASSAKDSSALNGVFATTDSGATWSDLVASSDDPFSSSKVGTEKKYVDALFFAGNTLFVSAHSIDAAGNDLYDLYYYDGTSFTLAGPTMTGLRYCITDLTYSGGKFWAINQEKVFVGTADGAGAIVMAADTTSGSPTSISGRLLCGLVVDSSGRVHVSTYDDYLFTFTIADSSWNAGIPISENGKVSTSIHLGKIAEISKGPSGSTLPKLIVADNSLTKNYGYYEYVYDSSGTTAAVGGADGILAGGSSIYNSTIKGKPVNVFYISKDADNPTFFVGLSCGNSESYALYSSSYSSTDGKWSGWSAE